MITYRYTRIYDRENTNLKRAFRFLDDLTEGTTTKKYRVIEYRFRVLDEELYAKQMDRYNILIGVLKDKGEIVATDLCLPPSVSTGVWRIVFEESRQ